ncbi:hypothetical protein Hanom_Chr14g01246081 [Helianthus anomalus]
MRFNPLILNDIGMRCVGHKLHRFKQVFDEHKNKQKVYGLFRGISRSDFSKEKSRNRTP